MTSTASTWDYLPQDEENELHKSRLFIVEEKPFTRITKRLRAVSIVANSKVRQTQTPPPEPIAEVPDANAVDSTNAAKAGHDADKAVAAAPSQDLDLAQFRDDITCDFAAFDYSIGRLQFLQSANLAQRERYATEQQNILDTCEAVRASTTVLRSQLAVAQATQRQREGWDALVRKINDNKLLVERPKQMVQLAKLEEECKALEAEMEAYNVTLRERKEQFGVIMEEAMRLRRQIRDEKEEVERREGMDEDEAGGGDGDEATSGAEGVTPRPGIASGNATPRPDGIASAVPRGLLDVDRGDATPVPSSLGGASPMPRASPEPSSLRVGDLGQDALSVAASPAPTPAVDVDMADATPAYDTEDKMDDT